MANSKVIETINELKEAEAVLLLSAKKCSNARRVLEIAAGLSQAPAKGSKVNEAVVIDITNRRRKNQLKRQVK